jgi:hypothetical protein
VQIERASARFMYDTTRAVECNDAAPLEALTKAGDGGLLSSLRTIPKLSAVTATMITARPS